jgi:hypothetical protein
MSTSTEEHTLKNKNNKNNKNNQNENKIDTDKKIKKKKKKKSSQRCCVCRKKDWTNMKCECGEMCCIFHLKRELHQCKIEHVIVNKDYMMKASAIPIKVNVI